MDILIVEYDERDRTIVWRPVNRPQSASNYESFHQTMHLTMVYLVGVFLLTSGCLLSPFAEAQTFSTEGSSPGWGWDVSSEAGTNVDESVTGGTSVNESVTGSTSVDESVTGGTKGAMTDNYNLSDITSDAQNDDKSTDADTARTPTEQNTESPPEDANDGFLGKQMAVGLITGFVFVTMVAAACYVGWQCFGRACGQKNTQVGPMDFRSELASNKATQQT